MLSYEQFEVGIKALQEYDEKRNKIEKFLASEIIDESFISLKDSAVNDALLVLLESTMNDKYEMIHWWLYDSPDNKNIYKLDSNEVLCELLTIHDLYDYIIETSK